jgi:hypothetical protein
MSFSRLATVEVQLVMQNVDLQSLLKLARCSKFTLACALGEFAWRSLPVLDISFSADGPDHSALLPRSLLRHSGLCVRWRSDGVRWRSDGVETLLSQPRVQDEEMKSVMRLPRIQKLDVTERNVTKSHWLWILSTPCLADLRELHLNWLYLWISKSTAELLVNRCPQLSSLSFDLYPWRCFYASCPVHTESDCADHH